MIITGCQRSGTKTAASIFGLAHEQVFIPGITFEKLTQITLPLLESSWLAAPFASFIKKELKIPVIHLVRHPLAIINSLIGIQFFTNPGHKPYRDFIFTHLAGIEKLKDPITQAMYYWIYWNKLIVECPRIRIESIHNAPMLNSRNRASLTWADLTQGKIKTELETMATLYGYIYE